MEMCVMCRRKVQQAEHWIRCHLWGAFAIFHWRCFGEYLRVESEQQVENAVFSSTSRFLRFLRQVAIREFAFTPRAMTDAR